MSHRVVKSLGDREGWVAVADLASDLATASDGDRADTASETASDRDAERRRYRIRLHHVDLPALADRGVIVWHRTEGVVRLSDRSANAAAGPFDRDAAERSERGITDPQRRAVLDIVREAAPKPVTRDHLAREVAPSGDAAGDAATERVAIQLHHCHLPKLDEAGVIRYDSEAGSVSYRGPTESPAVQSAE
ncbi:DUF7344 domain-containing protein [Halovivax limisalsi]|uniref:DUF7344 domain-containing protein n=1 Tax=Halovivax limisalsi TaxID=1453760 RepID=UPI001FFDB4E1|nr:hypothetical protein [Halovivax limisalsi]